MPRVGDNFMQNVCILVNFFGDKKNIAFKISLDLHFDPLIFGLFGLPSYDSELLLCLWDLGVTLAVNYPKVKYLQ